MAGSTKGEFRGLKRMKIWKEKKTGYKCIVLFPTSFSVINGGPPYWVWDCFDETSDENTVVAKLDDVCWLEVTGHFNMSDLSAGIDYEIAYRVKLTAAATGWEFPVTFRIRLPNDSKVRQRQYSLFEKPREKWIDLVGGNFRVKEGETGEAHFDLFEHGGHWKSGLIIQGIIIKPKNLIMKR